LGGVSASPDGRYFAFSDRADEKSPYDLFGRAVNGSQQWKIASDIVSWDWGPGITTAINGNDESFSQATDLRCCPITPILSILPRIFAIRFPRPHT